MGGAVTVCRRRPCGRTLGVAALGAVVLSSIIVYAVVLNIKTLYGVAMVKGAPMIWYDNPDTPGVGVALTADKQHAEVDVRIDNRALHIYDYNASGGIVAMRGFYTAGIQRFSIEWDVLSVEILDDPENVGVVLGEAVLVYKWRATTYYYFFSFYYYADGRIVPAYWSNSAVSGECDAIEVNPWQSHSVNVTAVADALGVTVYWYLDGWEVCSLTVPVNPDRVVYVAADAGRYDYTNTYNMYIDNVRIVLSSGTASITVIDDFEDGIDQVFVDTYYTSVEGTSRTPPPDGSVGKYVKPAFADIILNVDTSMPNGTVLASWMELAPGGASCKSSYTEYSIPIVVKERSGSTLYNYTVRVELNSTNFPGWNVVSPDGSDIYFTNAWGEPLYYWIESIDVDNKHAVIWVKLPILHAYSEATVYMHYGGFNPFADYNDPNSVFLFYDSFDYDSVDELLTSGKWVGVETHYISNVSDGVLYIGNGDNAFALRSTRAFMPPFVVEFSLAACYNYSSDWDSGIAVGWDNETYYVAFLDDVGGVEGYVGTFMAITEGLEDPQWLNSDYIDQPRLDLNWLAFHVYAVYVDASGDMFVDESDGRSNVDDYYYSRSIVQVYGNISGYLWLVNDGDTGDNCAAYDWVRVRRYSPYGEPAVYVLSRATPLVVEYLLDAGEAVWSDVLRVENYTLVVENYTGVVDLAASSSVVGGNLSRIALFATLPPGAGVLCSISVVDAYGLIPEDPSAAVLVLSHRVNVSSTLQ